MTRSKSDEVPASDAITLSHYLLLGLLTLLNVLNIVDRQLLSSFANFIVPDLGLTNTQFGLLTGLMFMVFYSFMREKPACIPVLGIAAAGARKYLLPHRRSRLIFLLAGGVLYVLSTGFIVRSGLRHPAGTGAAAYLFHCRRVQFPDGQRGRCRHVHHGKRYFHRLFNLCRCCFSLYCFPADVHCIVVQFSFGVLFCCQAHAGRGQPGLARISHQATSPDFSPRNKIRPRPMA